MWTGEMTILIASIYWDIFSYIEMCLFQRSLPSPMSSSRFQAKCQNSMEFWWNPDGWSLSHSDFQHWNSNRIQWNPAEMVRIWEPPGTVSIGIHWNSDQIPWNSMGFHWNSKEMEVLSVPHMFWSALIRIRNPPSPAILAGKQLSNGPTQSYSVLISTDQSAQHWSVHSVLNHWNQFSCWVMLNRTEFYTSITAVIILIIKKKCMNKDWAIAFKDVTWLNTDNITTRPYSNYKTYNHHFIYVVLVSTFPNECQQMPTLDLPSTTIHTSLLPQPPSSMMPTNTASPRSPMATTAHNAHWPPTMTTAHCNTTTTPQCHVTNQMSTSKVDTTWWASSDGDDVSRHHWLVVFGHPSE